MTGHDAIFQDTKSEPALPGTYGIAPTGFRLPEATHVSTVHLQVADLPRSITFYEQVLGLRARRDDTTASLHADEEQVPLVVLHERAGAAPAAQRGRLGLYHFAILLPSRMSLGAFVRHLATTGVRAGAGDHVVSEAFYLSDPDGHGIEVYADRPRESWTRIGRELVMATDPVNVKELVKLASNISWNGMPHGTRMGHVHLHVGDLELASRFYSEALGFDRMVMRYPGALFLAAGGYHHHLGTNTWAGDHAAPPEDGDARLIEWTIVVPDGRALNSIQESLEKHGFPARREGESLVSRDPWDTQVRVVVEGANR